MILSGAGSLAHAQVVTFSDISDAVAGRFFNPATTTPSSQNGNTLVIGIHPPVMDFTTFKTRDFKASTLDFSRRAAMDTISFRVRAPKGYYIKTITYTQRGTGSVLRTGQVSGAAHWVVGDRAFDIGGFSTSPGLTRMLDLSAFKLTFVPVSITASLFAFATPSLGSATLALTGAEVRVQLAPLGS
jgi:hypothetical protein